MQFEGQVTVEVQKVGNRGRQDQNDRQGFCIHCCSQHRCFTRLVLAEEDVSVVVRGNVQSRDKVRKYRSLQP